MGEEKAQVEEHPQGEKRSFFRRAGKHSRRVLLLALIVAAQPTRLSLAIGLSIAAASEMLIILSYGMFHRKGETRGHLMTTGPFAFLRNPVYLGYMMVGVGFAVAAGFEVLPAALGVIYLAIVIPNYLIRIRREESLLAAQFGEEFEAYCRRVRWRLVPSPLSGVLHGGFRLRWSLRLAMENRTIAKAGKTLTWMLVFIAKWAVISKWERTGTLAPWTHRDLPWFLGALAAAILVMVLPALLRRSRPELKE
jgi:protein-S-isoprenylcysteine O-methyltransferase Ste14